MNTNNDAQPHTQLPDGTPLSNLYEPSEDMPPQPVSSEEHLPDGAPLSHVYGPEDADQRDQE